MVDAQAGRRCRGLSNHHLRIPEGPESDPVHQGESNSDPRLPNRGQALDPPATAAVTELRGPRRRRRVTDLREEDAVVIAPPRIEVCTVEHWQAAIDLLADLVASAFERRPDESKAA